MGGAIVPKYTPTDPKLYEKVKQGVKARVDRRPSAYASGQLVKEYKAKFKKKYGDKSKPYKEKQNKMGSLERWYKEEWVDLCRPKTKGKYQACGRQKMQGKYPFCRPFKRVDTYTPMTVGELIKKFGSKRIDKICKRKQVMKKKRMKKTDSQ